jgi:hypothetical protein
MPMAAYIYLPRQPGDQAERTVEPTPTPPAPTADLRTAVFGVVLPGVFEGSAWVTRMERSPLRATKRA